MKKSLFFAIMAAMSIGLVGCGGTSNTENTGNTEVETTVEVSTDSEANTETNDSAETETAPEEVADAEPAVDLEYATLYDKYVGYTVTIGYPKVNMMRYNNTEEYHGYIDIDGTAVKITVLVKSGTDTSVFYGYIGTVIDGIYIPQ